MVNKETGFTMIRSDKEKKGNIVQQIYSLSNISKGIIQVYLQRIDSVFSDPNIDKKEKFNFSANKIAELASISGNLSTSKLREIICLVNEYSNHSSIATYGIFSPSYITALQEQYLNKDVDYVLTTRELARMIKKHKINFKNLKDDSFDAPLGISSGAATLFGATGGVTEAALRTAYELETGKDLEILEFNQIRGLKNVKEGNIMINGYDLNFVVVNGLHYAKELLEQIKQGVCKYDFIEVMACPGGCIGGGGQPIPTTKEIIKKRMQALYANDESNIIRRSYENPAIKLLYKEYLGRPLSEKAEEILHTKYTKRGI